MTGMKSLDPQGLRVCIVAENASFTFGGEASLPLHYYSRLRARGMDVRLIVHGRTRKELEALFPDDGDRMLFIPDQWFHKLIWRLSSFFPRRISEATFGTLMVLVNQWIQRNMIQALVGADLIDIVHQPIPVSPRAPSLLFKLGVPVVMGPLNGGMEYPKAFRKIESLLSRASIAAGRRCSELVNRLIPGKRLARVLLVANQRTRLALPSCVMGEIVELPENGVDLRIWSDNSPKPAIQGVARFVFLGRLVDWKRLDFAIRALATVPGAHLDVIGDGPMRAEWTQLAERLNLSDRVTFRGWLRQSECARYIKSARALLLPSIYECGGAVILESMAAGTPVVAVAWGGPLEYLDEHCGILVPPISEASIIEGFSAGIRQLGTDSALRSQLSAAAQRKVRMNFNWEDKIDQILKIYGKATCTEETKEHTSLLPSQQISVSTQATVTAETFNN
jgi:glycosyltransferase involved in cell wall biosynthesis